MFYMLLLVAFAGLVAIGAGLAIEGLYRMAARQAQQRTSEGKAKEGALPSPAEPLQAYLEVGPQGAVLRVGDREVPLAYRDHRALGEAGQYLVPGARLRVRGTDGDEAWLVATSALMALGIAVGFEE